MYLALQTKQKYKFSITGTTLRPYSSSIFDFMHNYEIGKYIENSNLLFLSTALYDYKNVEFQ